MKRASVALLILLFACLLSFPSNVSSQEGVCPAIVQRALAAVDDLCSQTGRNPACYSNLILQAEPQPGVTDLRFDAPGDIADVIKAVGQIDDYPVQNCAVIVG